MKRVEKPTLSPAHFLPADGVWLWGVFCALDDTRECGMGIGPITFVEMKAYADLFGFDWTAPEIHVIRKLDRAFRVFKAEQQAQQQTTTSGEATS